MSVGRHRRAGFSLLEMLLAVAVAGLLLATSSLTIVSLTDIWARRTNLDAFEEHADAVAGLLQNAFDQSVSRRQPAWQDKDRDLRGSTGEDNATAAVGSETNTWTGGIDMAKVDSGDRLENPKIHFSFFHMPAVLGADAPAGSPGVETWLAFDRERGLALIWKDTRSIQKKLSSDDKDLLRSSLLSSSVISMEYIYLRQEEKNWKSDEEPIEYDSKYSLPEMIRLTFREGERTSSRTVTLPRTGRSMPLF